VIEPTRADQLAAKANAVTRLKTLRGVQKAFGVPTDDEPTAEDDVTAARPKPPEPPPGRFDFYA